jgi:hypothetical protein
LAFLRGVLAQHRASRQQQQRSSQKGGCYRDGVLRCAHVFRSSLFNGLADFDHHIESHCKDPLDEGVDTKICISARGTRTACDTNVQSIRRHTSAVMVDQGDALMQAIRVHRFGGVDALVTEDVPRPSPAEGEVLLEVKAAGVGPWDAWISPRVGDVLPLAAARTAHENLAGRPHKRGKIVLTVNRV